MEVPSNLGFASSGDSRVVDAIAPLEAGFWPDRARWILAHVGGRRGFVPRFGTALSDRVSEPGRSLPSCSSRSAALPAPVSPLFLSAGRAPNSKKDPKWSMMPPTVGGPRDCVDGTLGRVVRVYLGEGQETGEGVPLASSIRPRSR